MEQLISATDANHRISELLRGAREGTRYVVTSHGTPVACIVPFEQPEPDREDAKHRLLAHLDAQEVIDIGPWTRQDLYEG